MADDERLTWGFILEVLDLMERHGYRRTDSEHTGRDRHRDPEPDLEAEP